MKSTHASADYQRISVRDANQGFSKLIARVQSGERFIVTKNNEEVARLEPAQGALAEDADARRREAARARLKRFMAGGQRSTDGWTYKGRREDLHGRDV